MVQDMLLSPEDHAQLSEECKVIPQIVSLERHLKIEGAIWVIEVLQNHLSKSANISRCLKSRKKTPTNNKKFTLLFQTI